MAAPATVRLPMWLRIGHGPDHEVGWVEVTIEADSDTSGLVLRQPSPAAIKRKLAPELRALADQLEHEADHEEATRAAPPTG